MFCEPVRVSGAIEGGVWCAGAPPPPPPGGGERLRSQQASSAHGNALLAGLTVPWQAPSTMRRLLHVWGLVLH